MESKDARREGRNISDAGMGDGPWKRSVTLAYLLQPRNKPVNKERQANEESSNKSPPLLDLPRVKFKQENTVKVATDQKERACKILLTGTKTGLKDSSLTRKPSVLDENTRKGSSKRGVKPPQR